MIYTKKQKKHLFTPLRYPGGKTSLFEFFDDVISRHGWEGITYIEPYAGGAGAALSLLLLGKVKNIVINDYDIAVFSFWKSITTQPEDFIRLIETTPINVEQWQKQKEIYKAADPTNTLALGFATFFLNRTNRSGILNAGPIGGKDQQGQWKINARYNKQSLINKIESIALNSNNITVLNEDGVSVIEKYANKASTFMYIDPPYFVKGANLYLNAFKQEDHQKLANTLNRFSNSKWLLSYDNTESILDLYPNFNHEVFSLKYSAHHSTKFGSELMIYSDAIKKEMIDNI